MSKNKKVVDLHPDKPTPRRILEELLDQIEDVESVVVLVKKTDGGLDSHSSYMTIEDRAVLTKLNEFEMFQSIMENIHQSEDDFDDGA